MKTRTTSPLSVQVIPLIAITLIVSPLLSSGAENKKQVLEYGIEKNGKIKSAFDYVFTIKEWLSFPWEESSNSKLLAISGYANKQDQEGNTISSLTAKSTPLGPISIEAYSRPEGNQSTHSKIVVNLGSDGVNQAACDDHLAFLTKIFGKSMATRDVSTPVLNDYSVQWLIGRTAAVWRCVGINTPKRWSLITFSNAQNSKKFSDLIPLNCVTRTNIGNGDIKTHELQFIVDPYAEVIRQVDYSIVTTISNVQIYENKIIYSMTDSNYASTVEIDRGTGRYTGTTAIHNLNSKLETTGSCELFNPKQRKF